MLGMNTEIPSNQDFSPEHFNTDVNDLHPNHREHSDEIFAACEHRKARVASCLEEFDALFGKIGGKGAAEDGGARR